MLEAGSVGLPIVCFAGAGGGPEFVGSDAGLVAAPQDVAAFADQLCRLHESPRLREELGAAASRKVATQFSAEYQAAKLVKVIERRLPSPFVATDRHMPVPEGFVPRQGDR